MYREVIYKYLLKVKKFSSNTILFDLSINEKETLILIENLLLENYINQVEDDNYESNEKLLNEALLKLNSARNSEEIYYEFDYTNEIVEEDEVISLRSYYSFFKKLPQPNYIKDNFLLDIKNHNENSSIINTEGLNDL